MDNPGTIARPTLDPRRNANVRVGIVEQEGALFKVCNLPPREALALLADFAEDLRIAAAREALEGGGRRVELVPGGVLPPARG